MSNERKKERKNRYERILEGIEHDDRGVRKEGDIREAVESESLFSDFVTVLAGVWDMTRVEPYWRKIR